jgi:hypothetical protein
MMLYLARRNDGGPSPSDVDVLVDGYIRGLESTGRYDAYELERAASTTRREAEKWHAFLWIAAHPEHFLQYRHDESKAAARARKRRREKRRTESRPQLPAG